MTPHSSSGRSAAKARLTGRVRHYRDLLLRKWWVPALGAVAGGLAAAGIACFEAPSYLSVGQMIVNVKLAIPQGAVFTEELNNFLGTQAALMQSDTVVNRAYARLAQGSTNVPAGPPLLRVSVSPRTTIFNLQASGPDPVFTQDFLQAGMEEYVRLKREMRKQASDSTVSDLTDEVIGLERELRKAEDQIAEFQATNSMVWLEEQGNSIGNYLAGLNQRLESLKSEHDLLRTLTLDQNLHRQDAGGAWPARAGPQWTDAPDAAGSTNAVVNNHSLAADYLKARQQLLLMKAEQEDLGQFLRPKHPKMVLMSEDIGRRERLLEIYRQQNVEQLEARKASVALQIQGLEKDLAEWNARVVEISRKAAQYTRLKSNAQRIQSLYQQLLGTVQSLDANKEIGAETVSIMEPACPAFLDTRRSRNKIVLAAFGCVLASLALLLLLDRLDDRVNSLCELQELFEENLLVQIPRQKAEGRSQQLNLLQPHEQGGGPGLPALRNGGGAGRAGLRHRHGFVEAYRNLRSSLLYLEAAQPPRTLLLTSSVPAEGKSVTAANLAITLASSGSRVLLVDADLRKGVLHDGFGLGTQAGLCEVLREGRPWDPLVQTTKYSRLFLLPRGAACNEAAELFLSPAMRLFLEQAAGRYDFVILDSPPVMAADDVTSLAPQVEGVLFVLRAEQTSARVAHAALDLLNQRKARILGIIFNGVRPGSGDYYCYQYEDYYT